MKAFSFQSIFKNFSKITSLLATKMPWCNLRVNLGTISRLSRVNPLFSHRASRYAAILTILFTIGVGSVWGVDFNVDIDQIRVLPTRSAFVQISAGNNVTASSGKLNIANSKTGTFTIASTIPEKYKIKSIAISVSRNVTGFTCTDGGTLSGSNASWTFTPTGETPVDSASFSLNNTSGGAANLTFVVTMTTAEATTVEELKTFTYSDPNFSFTSSVATSQVTIKNKANASAGSNYINLSKSSNERSITIAAKTGYNLKFISFYYYDSSSDPTVTPSVDAYTKELYTWMPSSPTTTVDFVFDASSAGIKIWKIYVGYEAAQSCDAADLTAANITSNGDQIVGTGITFSKVGSPASGDTWYWQTSATGTDKTYNASSSYTTATTAGSYTVYLRAYNTAADCWGKAIGKTNTIISCPFDVYNGENVDKGNKTASGWTINSSTNMAKTSGSSNDYSNWYQAGSASNYVQFDGSIALVSGDQIKIQWTHTASSDRTLALTINSNSVSLTSGSTAKNSVLTEAIYNVTSATNVTSIKLNSSGSSGCIIYQVSIVKAACTTPSETYDIHIGKNNANYTDESLTNTSGTTWSKTITLDAGSYYEFKVKKTPSAGDAVWYGNNGRIFGTTSPAWDFSTGTDNCKLYTSVAGSYTFSWDASNNKLTVTYPAGSHPTKRIYMACGDTWCKDSPRFFVHSWLDSNTADTELTVDACDGDVYTADIPWFHDYVIFTRQAPASTGIVWEGSNFWNRSNGDFYLNNYNKLTFTSWTDGKGNFSGGTYSPATYSITFNGNGNTGGSMTNVTGITCGGSTTLAANTFTRTGYTFAGWATSANGDVAHADKASISNITSDITLYAKWTAVQYDVTLEKGSAAAAPAGNSGSAKVLYDATALTNISHATWTGHVLTGYYTSNSGGTKVLNADGTFAAANVSGYITDNKWTRAENTTVRAQWTCAALTLVLDGDAATPAGGSPIGTEYTLTCSASTGAIASYQWKQNTTASTTGAVDAEGTGATTASFSPVPAAAGTYYYYCVATDACDNSVNTAFSGAFTFTAPVVPYATSIDFEAIIDESGTGAAWKTTMEGRNYMLTQADGSKWSLDGGDSGNKPADKGLKIKETGDNAGKITFTVRANQTVELKVGTLAGTGSGVAKFSTDGGSSYSNITGAATASTGVSVVTTYTGATDRTYVFKTNSASWNILQHIIIGYKITYDKGANGTGTIDPMYKTHGTNINLSSSTFTYAGHTQDGWSTSDGGSKVYELGASYTSDAPITLYPHWVEEVVVPTITATKTSPDYVSPDPNNVVLSISTTGASSGWYYRVKNTGTAGYQTPDNTPYNTATWTMTSGLALGENNFVVELYNGSGVKQAESGTITVTAETAYPITIAAGAGGSVSPSGEIKANESGNHIHPAITATPNSGYHFVNWTYSNSNATVADASSASTTVNDARGACTITANFEADAPVATPMITYNLNVGTSASASIGTSGTSTDPSNITSIAISQANAAGDGAGASNRTTKLPLATGENAASVDNPDKYVLFTFNVACGKKLTPSEVKIKVANVGGTAGGNQNYKAVLSDAYGHSISNTFTGANGDGTVEEFSITNGGGTYFQGNVTLKLWSCKGASGNASAFRMGTPLEIFGEVGAQATPSATITWDTQPANGQVGDADFTYAVSCSDGSAVTVTSDDTNIATIEDGKLHYVAEGTTHLVATATDACGNEITQNSNDFTVTAASVDPDPEPGECEDLFAGSATSTSEFTITVGNATTALSSGNSFSAGGYSYSVKPNSSNAIVASPYGGSFAAGDSLIVVVYNNQSGAKTMGFQLGSGKYSASVGSKKLHIFRQVLVASDISEGKVTFNRQSSDDRWVEIIIKHCGLLPSCTTPELSDLEDQIVCPGEDVSWTAIVNNTEDLADGETIAYQWTKKGNATILSETATLTLTGITEAAGGTYVVTATVSADGKASTTATKEVTLTVRPATATPTITANANTIYTGNSVTLTATCASSGVGYQWYTCNDAEGNGESEIGGAENAEYTFTAGEAGTYYYKVIVTGDGTHSCGTAEKVYTLIVSAAIDASDCTTYFWFPYAEDATTNKVTNNENKFFGNSPKTGSSNSSTYNFELDGTTYTATKNTGSAQFTISFTVPENSIGTMAINCKGSSSKPLYLRHTDDTQILVSDNSSDKNFVIENITPGTWTLQSSGNWALSGMAVKVCSGSTCTDPEVIATVDNATVCAGESTVTFTATNYADGATFQWQKKNGNTWENISEANSATYTISPVTTEHAGQYRVIATNECSRTSEELTLTVLTAPEFNAFANTASVMKGNALTINDVEATNATDYTWYKSADNSLDVAADTKVGTSKDLLLAASSITEEANQTFYLFCVASNSCGSVTSNAITVTVTPFVEEECATKGNEGEHEFKFTNTSCSSITYESKSAWETNSSKEYLTYTAPTGRYFATAKVTVAHTNNSKAVYGYSTDGGTTWTYVETSSAVPTAYTTITIELPADVNAFRIGRNMDGKGTGTGKFYLYEACFTYENACTPTSVTPTTTSFEYNMSVQMDFVEPTFTVKHGEEVVNDAVLIYTSSNPAIATVDEDGSVTFEGMTGTVTITAAYAGITIDEIEYCASEGSYKITVGCQDQEPKIIAAAGTNLDGCNNSITLEAKMQDGTTAFTGGTYQWYRDGEAIEGATSASYEVVRAGTYTVSRTDACTKMSSNSAVVTNENPEPKVERLTPFQYYHVDKTYSNQMKGRHLFAVTSYGTLDGKRYHLTATRNGEAIDLSSSTAFFTIPSSDNAVDTVMIDLNELKGKYSANDEIVITCAPINNCNQVSAITSSITIHVIDQKPTLALICSGSNKAGGTRKTSELTVGGDFLTGYNVADLCQQTGNTSFDANTEWGFYTELKTKYIVTPVNGYAEFNKLNYEPFDILLLTDYPKASKSEAAATILDDMAALCDYRPLLSLKAHMVAKSPSKWAAKGFTTSPVVPAATSQYANIVCYAHPMFDELDNAQVEGIYHDNDDFNQLVYQILTGPGHESGKGLQGFELKDADNFVTIGLIHYNAAAEVVTHTDGDDTHTHIKWTPAANDRQLVAIAERQANIEARMILFAINCGAQSMQTPMGRQVLLTCLDYLLKTDPIQVADCRLTFDNGKGNTAFDPNNYEGTGTKGDGLWSTAANWGPDYLVVPGRNNDVRIAAPCTVDANNVEVLSVHITEDGSLTIPADKSLTARSTILRADEHGNVYPTNVADISLGSNAGGNASLILNNERGDTKAGVAMYSTADADTENYSAAASTWQYIGTPHSDVQNAANNYYDSWLYQYDTGTQGWVVIPNGGPLVPFRGYCVTHPESPHTYWMEGTLVSTTNQDISIPANKFVVVANSWTAPIQINELTDDDMEGLTDKTIYFFNTGSDPNQEGELDKENGRYAAGTYVSVPIHSAPYTGDSYIPSMQGFYVVGGGADGTLHLDYERHVRAKRENVPSGPMHAPARRVVADDEPQVAKFLFRGTRYDDRLIILERPDFTRGYDSGWDGEQWGGNAAAPMSYVVTETRWDAVSAIPEYEGTVIAFRAGEDSEYTIHFDYDGMEDALYLLDTDTQIYTRVLKGNSYTFTCADKAEHNRFILTRKAPQIATGTENINTGENAKAVKFIKDDKIFIFVNGMLYDATGKMVIR